MQQQFILLKNLLITLQETKLVKVTGSYADGTQNEDSDIDFKLKDDNPETYGKNIKKIIGVFAEFGVEWSSTEPGYIFTHKSDTWLPIPIEVSDRFDKRPNKLKTVEILGVTFNTH